MRTYVPHYGIPQARYNELRSFCLQYPLWQAEAKSLLGVSGQRYSSAPHGSGVSDPVARAVERREKLLAKIDLVERVARAVDGGRWYAALIQNCCMGKGYTFIDPAILPTSNRNAFYQARRVFFIGLDEARDKI